MNEGRVRFDRSVNVRPRLGALVYRFAGKDDTVLGRRFLSVAT